MNVRQPLAACTCVAPYGRADLVAALVPLLAAELNVKSVQFATSADALVSLEAKPNFRTLGKVFGKHMKEAAAVVTALTGEQLRDFDHGAPLSIESALIRYGRALPRPGEALLQSITAQPAKSPDPMDRGQLTDLPAVHA